MPTLRKSGKKPAPYKPFDVTSKQLVELDPKAWLEYVGLPSAEVEIIDADLSTIVPEADKILKVHAPKPYQLNLEFQSTYEFDLPERVLMYHAIQRYRHHLRVKTAVLLLRPEADGATMTGRLADPIEAGEEDFGLDFHYRIIRVWEQPMEQLLTGSLALLPLAPLTDEAKEVLPNVVERMRGRIQQETTPAQGTELWAATFLLMGLRFEGAFIEQLLKGVQGMEESTTYQLLIERGEAKGEAKWRRKEAHELLLRIGNGRLGKPSADIREALNVASLEELEQMADRLLQVESWAELLPSRRRVKL